MKWQTRVLEQPPVWPFKPRWNSSRDYNHHDWRWRKAFAWFPVRTKDVGMIWFGFYWIYEERIYVWTECYSTKERWLTPLGRLIIDSSTDQPKTEEPQQ